MIAYGPLLMAMIASGNLADDFYIVECANATGNLPGCDWKCYQRCSTPNFLTRSELEECIQRVPSCILSIQNLQTYSDLPSCCHLNKTTTLWSCGVSIPTANLGEIKTNHDIPIYAGLDIIFGNNDEGDFSDECLTSSFEVSAVDKFSCDDLPGLTTTNQGPVYNPNMSLGFDRVNLNLTQWAVDQAGEMHRIGKYDNFKLILSSKCHKTVPNGMQLLYTSHFYIDTDDWSYSLPTIATPSYHILLSVIVCFFIYIAVL